MIRDGPLNPRVSMDRTISSSGSAAPGGPNRSSFDSNWDVYGEDNVMSAAATGDSSSLNAAARAAAAGDVCLDISVNVCDAGTGCACEC